MKLGARILKTGIAIVLALYLATLLELPSPVFAGIAAVFAVQPTIYRSYLSVIEQVQGNLIGAIIAVLFVLILGHNVVIIGLAGIIVITINLKLKIENTIPLSLVTVIAIMETSGDQFIEFSLIRFSTIMLGVLSAFIVNLVFLPPKYENKLYYKISNMTEEIAKWIRINIRHASEHNTLKSDIEKLKDTAIKLDQLFIMYKEERNYFKKSDLVKSRKLVIYRQMISTTKRALDLLKRLHRYENELSTLPEEFKTNVKQHLDNLMDRHEQVMLKFIGKIKTSEQMDDYCLNRKELFKLFLAYQKNHEADEESAYYHTMQVISAIIEYDEYLEHLDVLITSFLSYHKDENEVTIEEPAKE
ncbi:aromatic acid exporter family protein [Bacillus sp. 31A1R]|uniref:Aromatic acid exporter family protein n=1 Tax=Robertmurraya mangrovi TaxID=3098077 RepID=A0ABU5J545_9BACI|nr:aromatic acid exporter family protein [Bacillus sp. 31A1R]MDZ5474545.1 aromatic acid exporter family protein [Bacillus sp. 31A1R]